ncbi:hypothetical protein SPRG_15979 [Saprolegnia parasitica CBS 223.65]|uniref:ELMO domain-containing protein n=1 Tax=Saprolegnia parasitica (strain CBS 223.65) TaxID=695850 RepID=A0A067BVU6_SAPPC|nr:hypothetical protein SPRG_15979 [Saprolegnia parasitica CBS 223.65]KDO18692.1 hypothetical protein SPRG_15979 [Saprolegnia parasitica CBS 223.65]|eukprot:XP_012210602.1 hypothetical protein SPRG_15979 [Saprolegnia parasitica CBS 223.65]
MGNQQGSYNPARDAAEAGRRPDDHELLLLFSLQKRFMTRLVECPYHLGLLGRYWDSMHGNHMRNNALPFQRNSAEWQTIGFTSCNPGDDIRAGGELGLECLVFFVENYPGEARMLNRHLGYPLAKAAVAVVRVLMEILHVVAMDGSKGNFPVQETLYWQLLDANASFFQLFAFCLLMFDELYCEWVSTTGVAALACDTSIVAQLADQGKAKLLATLRRAPEHLTDLIDLCGNGQILRKLHLKLDLDAKKPKPNAWSKPVDLFFGLEQKGH